LLTEIAAMDSVFIQITKEN